MTLATLNIKTDLTRLIREDYGLPEGYDGTNPIQNGEWVELGTGNKVVRVNASTATASHNTFPVYTGSARADVSMSGTVTVVKGTFVAETDQYTGSVARGTLLTLKVDDNRGKLAAAANGNAIRAICEDVNAADSTITFRMLDTGTTA